MTGPFGSASFRPAEISGAVADAVLAILPGLSPADLRPEAHLKDLGADSIDRVEIIMTIIERTGIDEPLSSFSDLPDLASLVRFLAERRPAR
jgi:polyketide biosynthesis acyl carrier protein